jgi:hypothetical protein
VAGASSRSGPHPMVHATAMESVMVRLAGFMCRLRWGESLLTERVIYCVAVS